MSVYGAREAWTAAGAGPAGVSGAVGERLRRGSGVYAMQGQLPWAAQVVESGMRTTSAPTHWSRV